MISVVLGEFFALICIWCTAEDIFVFLYHYIACGIYVLISIIMDKIRSRNYINNNDNY